MLSPQHLDNVGGQGEVCWLEDDLALMRMDDDGYQPPLVEGESVGQTDFPWFFGPSFPEPSKANG